MTKITNFFLQPVTLRDTAAELTAIARALGIVLGLAIMVAAGFATLAHLPSIMFAGLAVIALMNGRLFAMIVSLMLALAWFNWLWGITPV